MKQSQPLIPTKIDILMNQQKLIRNEKNLKNFLDIAVFNTMALHTKYEFENLEAMDLPLMTFKELSEFRAAWTIEDIAWENLMIFSSQPFHESK